MERTRCVAGLIQVEELKQKRIRPKTNKDKIFADTQWTKLLSHNGTSTNDH